MLISHKVRFTVGLGAPLVMAYCGWFDDYAHPSYAFAWALCFLAVLWGVLLAEPVVELFPALGRLVHRHALGEWEGHYYKYGLIHLRAYEVSAAGGERGELWFHADDVLAVLGKTVATWRDARFTAEEYGMIPGHPGRIFRRPLKGFSAAGVLKLAALSAHPEAGRFRVWFERNVVLTQARARAMREGA